MLTCMQVLRPGFVPADGLAPIGARTSAVTLLTIRNFSVSMSQWPVMIFSTFFNGQIICFSNRRALSHDLCWAPPVLTHCGLKMPHSIPLSSLLQLMACHLLAPNNYLTHWPLGNLNEILDMEFSNRFLLNVDLDISCEIALIWMSLDFTDDQSILVQVKAWCRQATSHYLSQCWPRSLSLSGVTRPQWVKQTSADLFSAGLLRNKTQMKFSVRKNYFKMLIFVEENAFQNVISVAEKLSWFIGQIRWAYVILFKFVRSHQTFGPSHRRCPTCPMIFVNTVSSANCQPFCLSLNVCGNSRPAAVKITKLSAGVPLALCPLVQFNIVA